MSLLETYRAQYGFRAWDQVYAALPLRPGQVVLDIGCAHGDQAAALAERGARVTGVDADTALLEAARARSIPDATLLQADARALPLDALPEADGVWMSFLAAYVPDPAPLLRTLRARLRPGGWLAAVEADDLLGHEPMPPHMAAWTHTFYGDALAREHHDFRMGRRLAAHIGAAGLRLQRHEHLPDAELSFDGPASTAVLEAWAERLARMKGLQAFLGPHFGDYRDSLLRCLADPAHTSRCRVHLVLAEAP